jgi:small subunit ribosomal protein S20
LANSRQATKRARQGERRRQHNATLRSRMRTYLKKTLKAIEAGDKSSAENAFKEAVPLIDSSAGKNIIHANKAARHKSRLSARIRAMSS